MTAALCVVALLVVWPFVVVRYIAPPLTRALVRWLEEGRRDAA
jgi:hypothetical protein